MEAYGFGLASDVYSFYASESIYKIAYELERHDIRWQT